MQRIALGIFAALTLSFCAHGGALENLRPGARFDLSRKKRTTTETNGISVTQLDLTSQKWRDSVWTHTLQVVRPAKVRNPDIALLFVTGEGNGTRNLLMLQIFAERAGAMAAVITRGPVRPVNL